jgi:C1A family cysteine protease
MNIRMPSSGLRPAEFGLGDRRVGEDHYAAYLKTYEALASPATARWDISSIPAFDARTRGWVTPAKHQGRCASGWAHAAVATLESRILKEGGPQLDLSEQQQISCNMSMDGCCGGNGSALLFYCRSQPFLARSAPYVERDTTSPTQRTQTAADLHGTPAGYLASGYYTVDLNLNAMKKSITEDGPCYFRFDVYDDFYDFWTSFSRGAVYVQQRGKYLGGHAVLIIGWSDAKRAWLVKNSWGADTGPQGNGMCWIAYGGHANDLGFQMFNISSLRKTLDVD